MTKYACISRLISNVSETTKYTQDNFMYNLLLQDLFLKKLHSPTTNRLVGEGTTEARLRRSSGPPSWGWTYTLCCPMRAIVPGGKEALLNLFFNKIYVKVVEHRIFGSDGNLLSQR